MFCCTNTVDDNTLNLNLIEVKEVDYRQFKIIICETLKKIAKEIEEKEEEFNSPTKEDISNSRLFHGSLNNPSSIKTPQESQILDTNYFTEKMKKIENLKNLKKKL